MSDFLKFGEKLFFTKQTVTKEKTAVKTVKIAAHHTFIIDCSGSMYGELPQIRKDLKNKISTMLKEDDSLSIIWFSGRGQYGCLLEDYTIKGALALAEVNKLIDKYLTTQGLTAFKEPIDELKKLIARVKANKPNAIHTMMFLTDGYDNQWSSKEIIASIEAVKEDLASATIVEYGWYCNKQLLNQMATAVGGVHAFSKDFDEVEPYVAKTFGGESSAKRRYVKLDHEPAYDVVFNIVDGDIITYKPNEDNEIFVSDSDTIELYYFSEEQPKGKEGGYTSQLQGLYGAAFAFSRKNNYDMVSIILKMLGDAYLITEKANTFGSQKINELEAKFIEAMNNPAARYTKGYNPDLEPAEDAFCVLDMLDLLMSDDKNVWYPRHEAFGYKRAGSKTVAKKSGITEEQKETLKTLIDSGDLKAVETALLEVVEAPEEIKFQFAEEMPASSFSNLTWNESRANLSVQVTYKGYVNLPKNSYNLPEKFDTVIFRNYMLIKDGVVYTYVLPVSLSKETFETLQKNGLLEGETYEEGKILLLDFSTLPVINRKMSKTLSAEELFKNIFELTKLQANNTVFTQYKKRLFDGANKGFLDLYGVEATEWLKGLGLRDYGFNPPSTVEKTGEEIFVNTLDVKIKGMASSITKADFEKVEKKIKEGVELSKLTDKEMLAAPAILDFINFENTLSGLNEETKSKVIQEWLYSKSEAFRKTKTQLMNDISKAKFLIIVGKSWFYEFKSRDEKELTITVDDKDLSCSVVDEMTKITL
jgi:hypothetical protein